MRGLGNATTLLFILALFNACSQDSLATANQVSSSLQGATNAMLQSGRGDMAAGKYEGSSNCGITLQVPSQAGSGSEYALSGSVDSAGQTTVISCPQQRALYVACEDAQGCAALKISTIRFEHGASADATSWSFFNDLMAQHMRSLRVDDATAEERQVTGLQHNARDRRSNRHPSQPSSFHNKSLNGFVERLGQHAASFSIGKKVRQSLQQRIHAVYARSMPTSEFEHALTPKVQLASELSLGFGHVGEGGPEFADGLGRDARLRAQQPTSDVHGVHAAVPSVRNGDPSTTASPGIDNAGGCLLVSGINSVSLSGVDFVNCSATYGGGVAVISSQSLNVMSTQSNNCVARQGGVIFTDGTAALSNSDFTSTAAASSLAAGFISYGTAVAAGSALYASSLAKINNVTLDGCVSLAVSNTPRANAWGAISALETVAGFTIRNLRIRSTAISRFETAVRCSGNGCLALGGALFLISSSSMVASDISAVKSTHACSGSFCIASGAVIFVRSLSNAHISASTFVNVEGNCNGDPCFVYGNVLSTLFFQRVTINTIQSTGSITSCQGTQCNNIGGIFFLNRGTQASVSNLRLQQSKASCTGKNCLLFAAGGLYSRDAQQLTVNASNFLGTRATCDGDGCTSNGVSLNVAGSNNHVANCTFQNADVATSGAGGAIFGGSVYLQGGDQITVENITFQNLNNTVAGYQTQLRGGGVYFPSGVGITVLGLYARQIWIQSIGDYSKAYGQVLHLATGENVVFSRVDTANTQSYCRGSHCIVRGAFNPYGGNGLNLDSISCANTLARCFGPACKAYSAFFSLLSPSNIQMRNLAFANGVASCEGQTCRSHGSFMTANQVVNSTVDGLKVSNIKLQSTGPDTVSNGGMYISSATNWHVSNVVAVNVTIVVKGQTFITGVGTSGALLFMVTADNVTWSRVQGSEISISCEGPPCFAAGGVCEVAVSNGVSFIDVNIAKATVLSNGTGSLAQAAGFMIFSGSSVLFERVSLSDCHVHVIGANTSALGTGLFVMIPAVLTDFTISNSSISADPSSVAVELYAGALVLASGSVSSDVTRLTARSNTILCIDGADLCEAAAVLLLPLAGLNLRAHVWQDAQIIGNTVSPAAAAVMAGGLSIRGMLNCSNCIISDNGFPSQSLGLTAENPEAEFVARIPDLPNGWQVQLTAPSGPGKAIGAGVVVRTDGVLRCDHCSINGNNISSQYAAGAGGGLYVMGTLQMHAGDVRWNDGQGVGGGIDGSLGGSATQASVLLDKTSVEGNFATIAADIFIGARALFNASTPEGDGLQLSRGRRVFFTLNPPELLNLHGPIACKAGHFQQGDWRVSSVVAEAGDSRTLNVSKEQVQNLTGFAGEAFLTLQSLAGGEIVCTACEPGTYSIKDHPIDDLSSPCKTCPFGANCSLGGAEVTSTAGKWGWINTKTNTVSDLKTLATGFGCRGEECSSINSCSFGRRGVLCGSCLPGYGVRMFSSACQPNATCSTNASWFIPLLLIGMVCYCAVLLMRRPLQQLGSMRSSVFMSLLFFYQASGIITTESTTTQLSGPTRGIRTTLFAISLGSFSIGQADTPGGCIVQGMTERGKLLANFLVYVLFILFMALFSKFWPTFGLVLQKQIQYRLRVTFHRFKLMFKATKLLQEDGRKLDIEKRMSVLVTEKVENHPEQKREGYEYVLVGSSIFSLGLTVYAGLMELCLRALTCRKLEGFNPSQYGLKGSSEWRWFYDGTYSCFDAWQVAPLLGALSLLALPGCCILWARRHGSVRSAAQHLPPLQLGMRVAYEKAFRSPYRHWGMVMLYQRVCLMLLQLIADPFVRTFTTTVACLLLLVAENRAKAFLLTTVQSIHELSIVMLLSISVIELRGAALVSVATSPTIGPGAAVINGLLASCQFVCICLPLCLGILLLRSKTARQRRRTIDMQPETRPVLYSTSRKVPRR